MEFARAQGVPSKAVLLSDHAERFSFQINSRTRASALIDLLARFDLGQLREKTVLDIGCAYGSHSIAFAQRGATVVGIDISDKWLKLAEINAAGDAEVTFLNCDASSQKAIAELKDYGPFQIVIANDVFEHIYDTAGVISNIATLTSDDATVYFKIPNGLATRHVLLEGHKKVFGLSILPPDYWSYYVKAPFHIYYRRWAHFEAIFNHFGFSRVELINELTDPDIEATKRHIEQDMRKIRLQLKAENFAVIEQYRYLKKASQTYFQEVNADLVTMDWRDLFLKYRVTFWEGFARKEKASTLPSKRRRK